MAIRSPIVPTEIVVHLGEPDEAAKNITVSFVFFHFIYPLSLFNQTGN